MSNHNTVPEKVPSLFSSLLKITVDLMMIFIPSIGYIFQAIKFKQTKSSKGFSKTLCLLLLLANILRIFFWLGKPFSIISIYSGYNKPNIFNSCISTISR